MEAFLGTYRFDVENTARILAGVFGESMEMAAELDAALQQNMAALAENPDTTAIRLIISRESIRMNSPEGEEEMPILGTEQRGGEWVVQVRVDGDPMEFAVVDLGGGSIRLMSNVHQLGEYAWRRV